jgi:hypothetical protein
MVMAEAVMAEGIDEAAAAFAQEISPGSERPRDDSGRFSSTSPRPEPLFEPRDLEGDEKTGDTRDAGEDPRLAARERSIADGWLDEGPDSENQSRSRKASAQTEGEGGERRVQRGGEERGNAAADDGHPGAENEPAGDGKEGDAEADDVEAARWALTHDGKPVEKIEVDVGGETRQVSLQEVVKGYAEQETINQRARQIEEVARTFEQQSTAVAQEIGQARQTYQQRLEYIGRVMADLYPKELNWEQEYSADPKAARDKEKVYQHVRGRMTAIASEMQREQAEAQAQYQAQQQYEAQRLAGYIEDGKKEFRRRTGIADTATLNNEFAAMRKVGMEVYGFNEQEIATVFDPRMLHVLRDASEYRRLTANKPRPVMPDQGRTLAPGSARPNSGSAARRRIDDALKTQARNGGSIDATAAVFSNESARATCQRSPTHSPPIKQRVIAKI